MDTALVSTLACSFSVMEYVDVGWLYLITSCVLEKQPRLVLFHRKKVMGVLSNYFLGDVNLGAHSVNADHAIKTKLDIYFC